MSLIKIILVPILNPKDYKGTHAITPSGIVEFVNSDGKTHNLKTKSGTDCTSVGTLYQMVGFDPTRAEEGDYFLPVDTDQWRLCTKLIPRDSLNNLMTTLTDSNKIPHKIPWHKATITPTGYKIFQKVNV